jgi:hypothetical protein
MQPNYLPWRGYFDLINQVDHFVFYDNVQYTKKNWRNRNFINGINGITRLTVPVKANLNSLINEVIIDNTSDWASKHLKAIKVNYSRSKYFNNYYDILASNIFNKKWEYLSHLNIYSTILLCKLLEINTEFHISSEFPFSGSKNGEKIIYFCKHFNCDILVNGPTASNYLDNSLFDNASISIEYMNYNYPQYEVPNRVLYNESCSILDLLFNCGPEASKYFAME